MRSREVTKPSSAKAAPEDKYMHEELVSLLTASNTALENIAKVSGQLAKGGPRPRSPAEAHIKPRACSANRQ